MADTAASRTPRGSRSASSKRRASSASPVSADTENKLARAVQSAQRLAQLSDVPGDENTLDLFPDDPTHALVQSMEIDVRQGTLSGFELPDVVRAAVEAAQGASPAAAPAPRRSARSKAAATSDAAPMEDRRTDEPSDETAGGGVAAATDGTADSASPASPVEPMATRRGDGRMLPGRAAAEWHAAQALETRRSAALAGGLGASPQPDTETSNGGSSGAEVSTVAPAAALAASQSAARRADDVPGAGPASAAMRISPANRAASPLRDAAASSVDAVAAAEAVPGREPAVAEPDASRSTQPAPRPPAGDPARPASLHAARAPAASPELDRARATAFADTVDALYGVIADQRRAAAELTRRMKWMLSIVAGALLLTVGVGVLQTLLLSRLARDAAAQQQRVEQMMQGQQAALGAILARVAALPPAPAQAPAPASAPAAHPVPAVPRHAHGHRIRPASTR